MRGNVMDMAVESSSGGFRTIVTSLVKDVIMPPFGLLLGKSISRPLHQSVGTSYETLRRPEGRGGDTELRVFINTIINFVIVAFAIFIVIKQMNRLKKARPRRSDDEGMPQCLSTIPIKASRCAHCTGQIAA